MIIMVSYTVYIISSSILSNKPLYCIKIYNIHETETFFSNKIISNDGKCIVFINTFNTETTICAQNVSISKIIP